MFTITYEGFIPTVITIPVLFLWGRRKLLEQTAKLRILPGLFFQGKYISYLPCFIQLSVWKKQDGTDR
jgi:hypothetical protein